MSKAKTRRGYVGIVYDGPHVENVSDTYGNNVKTITVYLSKTEAKKRYEAIAAVEVKPGTVEEKRWQKR